MDKRSCELNRIFSKLMRRYGPDDPIVKDVGSAADVQGKRQLLRSRNHAPGSKKYDFRTAAQAMYFDTVAKIKSTDTQSTGMPR